MKKNKEEELKKRLLTQEDLIKMIDEEKEHLKIGKEIMEGDEINQEEDDSDEWEDLYIRQLEEESLMKNSDYKEHIKNEEPIDVKYEIIKIKQSLSEIKKDINKLFKIYKSTKEDENLMFEEVEKENEKMFNEVIYLIAERELLKEKINKKNIEIEKLKQQNKKEEMKRIERILYKSEKEREELKRKITKAKLKEIEKRILKNNKKQ